MNEFERTLNAENSLIGAILVDAKCMKDIPPTLRAEDFESEPCRAAYLAARDLEARGETIDPVTVVQWAKQHGFSFDNTMALELMDITPTACNAGLYAKLVHEHKLRRVTRQMLTELAEDDKTPLPQLISKTNELMANIGSHVELASDDSGIITADQCPYVPPRWLIEPYIQRGKGTLVQGNPGTGKTAFVCGIAAAVSAGKPILGLTVQTPGKVLMISTEDDTGVLSGRIEASGGNMKNILFMKNTASLTFNSPEIEQHVKHHNVRLVVFDPLQSFLGSKVDMFRSNETRPILSQLFEMCAKYDCACIIISHLAKATIGKPLVLQSAGSYDIPASMRSILHVVRNPELEGELLAIHAKSSNAASGKTIAYSIVSKGGVEWHELMDYDESDLRDAEVGKKKEFNYEEDPLVKVLRHLMQQNPDGGWWSYAQVQEAAKQVLSYPLFQHARTLQSMMTKQLQEKLAEREGIKVELGKKKGGMRGILISCISSENHKEITDDYAQAYDLLRSV